MSADRAMWRRLEGKRVRAVLHDGTRLDGCQLVSAGRGQVKTCWFVADGDDLFVAYRDVTDLEAGEAAIPLLPSADRRPTAEHDAHSRTAA